MGGMDTPLDRRTPDDPLRLRELMTRAENLAREHSLHSVLVGLSGFEGDLVFPEIIDFVESALRVDDSIFRMTRERAVLLLTDVDRNQATAIVDRILEDFRENFPSVAEPAVGLGFYEVTPAPDDLSVKHVLPILFASPPKAH